MYLMGMELSILIFDCFSLKEKRNIIKSLKEKISLRYNVSIAEIGDNDLLNKTLIGVGIVSNNYNVDEKILNQIINFIDDNYHRIEIIQINWHIC